jgi:hypothetical protein
MRYEEFEGDVGIAATQGEAAKVSVIRKVSLD